MVQIPVSQKGNHGNSRNYIYVVKDCPAEVSWVLLALLNSSGSVQLEASRKSQTDVHFFHFYKTCISNYLSASEAMCLHAACRATQRCLVLMFRKYYITEK